MSIDRANLESSYRDALTAYVEKKAEEDLLQDALEIGRSALTDGRSLMDLLSVHHALVPSMIMRSTQTAEMKRRLARADEFLSQVAAPFEMTHRGWREITERLRAANETLERRVAERTAAHQASVERLDRAQRIAGIGSWELDVATGAEVWSKEMYRLKGLSLNAAASALDCIHDEDRARHAAWMLRLKAGNDAGAIEYRIQRPDGELRTVSAEGEPIRDASGAIVRIAGTLQDVTERKEAEARLRAELFHVARQSAMGQMGSALAHELNQPLTAILNYVRVARRLLDIGDAAQKAKIPEILDKAGDQAERAGQIIRRLREFVSKGKTERQVEPMRAVIEEACALVMVGATHQGVTLFLALDPAAAEAMIDRIQIQQVLMNLMRNACEAMAASECRNLTVSTVLLGDGFIEIGVTDTGPGLPPEVAANLFTPFVTTKSTGMGVGLSICQSIVAAHGGKIWTKSSPGGGTAFCFTVPAESSPPSG
jgi:PAS domain S-box-containing protein